MEVIDNSPIDVPATGIIITSERSVPMMDTNRLYLLSSVDKDIRDETIKAIESFGVIMNREGNYVNKYRYTVLDEAIPFDNVKEVADAVNSNGYDLVLPLYRPGADNYQYLLAKAMKGKIYETIGLMYYSAERVTKYHLSMLIITRIQKEPKKNGAIFKSCLSQMGALKDFISNLTTIVFEPAFGMVPLDKKGAIKKAGMDFHTRKKILSNMDDELDRYMENSDKESLKRLSAAMGKSFTLEHFMNTMKALGDEELAKKILSGMNPAIYEVNSVKFEICKPKDKPEYVPPVNNRNKNDGVYQLFINTPDNFCHIHFEDKSGFIIYLIYLLDRKKHTDKYEELDIASKEFEQEYLKLYKVVYPTDVNAWESYFTLTSRYEKDSSKQKRVRLGECIGTINQLVGEGCISLGISPIPHKIENVHSHIFTDASDIIVPKELLQYAV